MKKGSKSERDPKKLASRLDQLRQLNPEELREQWQTLFGADPPPKLRSSLLVQAIAYRLQEKALGGLKPATLRLLEPSDCAERRIPLPRKALSFAVADSTGDHGQSLVRSAVLRLEVFQEGAD